MRALWRLLGYVKPYLGRLALAAAMLAISGALMAAVVSTVKPLINRVLFGHAAAPRTAGPDILRTVEELLPRDRFEAWASEHAFVQVPLLIVAIFLVRGVLLYFGQFQTVRAGVCVIRDLRLELFEAVAHQSLSFFQTHPTGVVLSRILNDVMRLQRVTTVVLADVIRVAAMVPFLLGVAFWHEPWVTSIALVSVPVLAWPMARLGGRMRRAAARSQENMGELTSRLSEALTGVKVVQGFGMERYEVSRVRVAMERMVRAELKSARAMSLVPPVMELLGAATGAALFYVAGRRIASGLLDPGDFAVVLFSLGMLFASLRRLNVAFAEIQHAVAASQRVFDMLDREREIRDLPGAEPLPPFSRELRLQGVRFSYGNEAVLDAIDLTLRKGEMIALVGPSGAGKSTLASLVPRFYDPDEGRVLIDGRDVRTVTLASLREQIGLVTQETVLFDDTVRANIAYGRPDVPQERVIAAARAAHAHEFVERLPGGYEERLGERGTRLSAGQRQRLTIARALLKDPPILILDEATSALDAESEALVQQALEALMRGRTSLVIAHRLSTVRRADRIVVIDAGRIVEQGTHRELLARGGAYARVYELQFRETGS
ncbi:MAG TPA: ABC transporter ATP-binding protein [Candidatus Polarisedimenticolaceae bacterium]|nr:ABC transporter ATP-binding protein [Candidatus Polarisedimenticolaceae bacterium]